MILALMHACSNALRPREAEPAASVPCLAFRVSGHAFAVRMTRLKEIVRCGIIAVPRDKPGCVRGFYRHNQHLFPVIDLARRYSGHDTDIHDRSCLLIVTLDEAKDALQVGILAEEVGGLHEFDADDIKPLPDEARRLMNVDVLDGLVKASREYLMILAAERLLSRDEQHELRAYLDELSSS
ncbi:purine-binding chemotaxis protein CheW [Novimethylophilus kurashikiensis]|uniref:Purine-binding chemotaxis protein CheW n=1 Tax=Novimethylophilus kurashikiensis TaxID=1825523 RepID=A0A2R5F3V6_9PROT|nr:chemotaxis protein CheW [Novimethylophilus kurashikiensis]GBG12739.1 purine-binding chemotaxis protein CheW [Novimethylophilus kurashikiensis]